MQNHLIIFNNNIKDNLIYIDYLNNNCIIKYLRPHNQSSHNSIKSHHHIIIHLAYMQSPTKSQSINIYVFTNHINFST